jgi:hypothetical protein
MRSGFKWLIALLILTLLAMVFIPAAMMALQGGHP